MLRTEAIQIWRHLFKWLEIQILPTDLSLLCNKHNMRTINSMRKATLWENLNRFLIVSNQAHRHKKWTSQEEVFHSGAHVGGCELEGFTCSLGLCVTWIVLMCEKPDHAIISTQQYPPFSKSGGRLISGSISFPKLCDDFSKCDICHFQPEATKSLLCQEHGSYMEFIGRQD